MDQSRRLIHGEVQPGYKLGLGDSPSFISALLRYTAGLEVAPLGLSEVVSEPRLRRSPAAEAVFRSRSSKYKKEAPVEKRDKLYREIKVMSLFPSIYGKETHIDASY